MSKEAAIELPDADKGYYAAARQPGEGLPGQCRGQFSCPGERTPPPWCSRHRLDDHINEPITSVVDAHTGLLSPKSFFKGTDGNALTFPSVDAVILIRHLHQFQSAAAGTDFADQCREAITAVKETSSQGDHREPDGTGDPAGVVECFQAYTPADDGGREYIPGDLTWWMTV